jgi:hypothetical protein
MTHDKPRPSVQLTVATACQLASFDSRGTKELEISGKTVGDTRNAVG